VSKTFEGLGANEGSDTSDDVANDLILACDRDLDGKLNFSEML